MATFKGNKGTRRGTKIHIQTRKDIIAGRSTFASRYIKNISKVSGTFERACKISAKGTTAKKIDYMIQTGNTIHIIDFKSGGVYESAMKAQFAMYNFAIAREFPNVNIENHAIYIDNESHSYSIEVDMSTIEVEFKERNFEMYEGMHGRTDKAKAKAKVKGRKALYHAVNKYMGAVRIWDGAIRVAMYEVEYNGVKIEESNVMNTVRGNADMYYTDEPRGKIPREFTGDLMQINRACRAAGVSELNQEYIDNIMATA